MIVQISLSLVALLSMPAYAEIPFHSFASVKGFFKTDPALACEERFSPGSAYALMKYDIKEKYEASPQPSSPPVTRFLSKVFHRLGEENPKLSKLNPIPQIRTEDILPLLAIQSMPVDLVQKKRWFCQIFQNSVGAIQHEALASLIPTEAGKSIVQQCAPFWSDVPNENAPCITVSLPLSENLKSSVDSLKVNGTFDSEQIKKLDTTQFSFLTPDSISKLKSLKAEQRKLADKGLALSKSKQKDLDEREKRIPTYFEFLGTLLGALDNPLTSRTLMAILIKNGTASQDELSKNDLAHAVSAVDDQCLTQDGQKFKKAFLNGMKTLPLSLKSDSVFERFISAQYKTDPQSQDFGERLFTLEQEAIAKAPAPRRIVFRSFNDKAPEGLHNFADCLETGIFNLVQTLFAKQGNKELDLERMQKVSPMLHQYFAPMGGKVEDQESYDDKMRLKWDSHLSSLIPSLQLVANRPGKEEQKKYEIQATWANFSKLMKEMFPGCKVAHPIQNLGVKGVPSGTVDPKRQENISQSIDALSTCLSTRERPVRLHLKENHLDWEGDEMKTEHTKLQLDISGKKALEIEMGEDFFHTGQSWVRMGHFGSPDNLPFQKFWKFNE